MPKTREVPGIEDASLPQPIFFLRLRAIALGCIMFLCFLWIILFCIIIFLQWDLVDRVERTLILIMLLLDTFTLIMLPILLTRQFRPWLDAARVWFILLTHGGIAILFAAKSHSFVCIHSETSANQETVCSSLIIYLNIFNWLIPVLAIVYGVGLAILMHKLAKQQLKSEATGDLEKQASCSSSVDERTATATSTQSRESTLKKHLTLSSIVEIPQTGVTPVTARAKESLKRHLTCDSIYEVQEASSLAAQRSPSIPGAIYTPSQIKRYTGVRDSHQTQITMPSYYAPPPSTKPRDSLTPSHRVPVPILHDSVPQIKRTTKIHDSVQSFYTLNSSHEARQYAYAV